ncbi:hypothetical protein LIER_42057 [Lithospermum erythrorhizon]|uniref:Uncharacterized protein n=1 Tax=Lithospermum erythrorhizon TaxID=34254 RepID=A0AAV3RMD3_LITER
MTVGAIEVVAEQILQCTPTQLGRLVKEGIGFELEPIKSEFQDKMYLVLLRRTYSKRSDAQQRLLLVAYYDDIVPKRPCCTDSASPQPSEKTSVCELGVSPLKRQLDNVSIMTGSPMKKSLFPDNNVSSTKIPEPDGKQDCQEDPPSA